jgi:hypothetical protein
MKIFYILSGRQKTENKAFIFHDQQTSYFCRTLFGKLMSIYTGYEGSNRPRRYRKMIRRRYFHNLAISLMSVRNEVAHFMKSLNL